MQGDGVSVRSIEKRFYKCEVLGYILTCSSVYGLSVLVWSFKQLKNYAAKQNSFLFYFQIFSYDWWDEPLHCF